MLIVAGLALILAVATLLRFLDLGANPGGLYTDEATEALSAQRLLHDPGFRPVFLPEGGGREALFAYLVAGVFRVFGETPLALRATAAGIGVAGVLGIWLLARRYGVIAGLSAAAWAAGSLWLISISRNGMRNTLVPLFAALALASLLAWHDRPGRLTAVLAGATAALATLYTYQPLKLIPLLLIIWLAWLHRVNRPAFSRLRGNLPTVAIAFLLIGAPMIAAAVADPVSYFGRAAGVTFNPGATVDLPTHWLRTLGMFAITGDPNPRHDVAALPLLGWPLFAVAMVGGIRLWRHRREPAEALILWSLPVFLLPPLIATEGGSPHFLRALGLAAPLAVAIGLGVAELIDVARVRWGRVPAGAVAAGAGLSLVALAIGSGQAYLSRPVADRYDAYRYDLVAMAAQAGPDDVVVLDDYSATVIRFVDALRLPTIVAPGRPISLPGARVLALSRDDLRAALGPEAAQRAVPVARNPRGDTVVWGLSP
ncbi:MAG: glycosyltransferase family 39 protein [Chloroflexi bacterium]|nr:glycosyltransferase family 39 protein [Chloroflexota bacterium]